MSIVRQEPDSPPARIRPPLTKRLHPRHWVALDYLAAAVCGLFLFALLRKIGKGDGLFLAWKTGPLLALVVAVAMSVPVALRRHRPVAALIAVVVAATALATAAHIVAAPLFFLPVAYVLYTVAVSRSRRVGGAALATVLAMLMVRSMVAHGFAAGDAVSISLVVVIAWTIGYAVRQRRAYATRLQQQAASSAVTEERLRMARELHDVVAHSMTVIAVQAGFGEYVIDTQPADARAALGAIQATSREALDEMRRMLGVLRQPPPGRARTTSSEPNGSAMAASQHEDDATRGGRPLPAPPLRPAPGLADLDRLVARIAHAGVLVDLRVRGSRRELPAGVDLSAFRIVQEALTNVVKHAAVPSCRVTIDYLADGLAIEVTDDGPGGLVTVSPGPRGEGASRESSRVAAASDAGSFQGCGGHGIIGMRERVSLYGGQFSAAPLPERGFRVAARLPLLDGAP